MRTPDRSSPIRAGRELALVRAAEAPGILGARARQHGMHDRGVGDRAARAARHRRCCRRRRAWCRRAPRRASASARPGRCTRPARAIEPAPSVPSASGPRPAATAAAPPPLEPPGVRSRFQGLRVTPKDGPSVRPLTPNSGVVVLPMMMAPAARRRCTSTSSAAAGVVLEDRRAVPRRHALRRRSGPSR